MQPNKLTVFLLYPPKMKSGNWKILLVFLLTTNFLSVYSDESGALDYNSLAAIMRQTVRNITQLQAKTSEELNIVRKERDNLHNSLQKEKKDLNQCLVQKNKTLVELESITFERNNKVGLLNEAMNRIKELEKQQTEGSTVKTASSRIASEPGAIQKEFHVHQFRLNFVEALAFCRRKGMTLAEIMTVQENEAVGNKIKQLYPDLEENTSFYLGGTDVGAEGQFLWLMSGRAFAYTDWLSGQPDNDGEGEHCISLRSMKNSEFKWNDLPCSYRHMFICQAESAL